MFFILINTLDILMDVSASLYNLVKSRVNVIEFNCKAEFITFPVQSCHEFGLIVVD